MLNSRFSWVCSPFWCVKSQFFAGLIDNFTRIPCQNPIFANFFPNFSRDPLGGRLVNQWNIPPRQPPNVLALLLWCRPGEWEAPGWGSETRSEDWWPLGPKHGNTKRQKQGCWVHAIHIYIYTCIYIYTARALYKNVGCRWPGSLNFLPERPYVCQYICTIIRLRVAQFLSNFLM